MVNRISTLISALGVFAASMLLIGAVYEYREGAFPFWVGLGVLIVTSAVHVLVRDIRALRPRSRRVGGGKNAGGKNGRR
ncbi:hypothetical protein ACIQ7Q_23745 [Streptomyces sp. NPDC096176]|uniref:hypothetical protein n=1 Tax=Streptomyces sp. NPDC096176 TaxID=3366079 RepID=UPI003801D216